jgi:hypothetical protein
MWVTSNPTPAYVARISAVFNNNGSGVRGDLKAVVKAILMDSEARGDVKTEISYGHLREPILYVMGILRAANTKTDGIYPRGPMKTLGQTIFTSPTVFNFYQPDYPLPGSSTLVAPEFAIVDSTTALARANVVDSLLFNSPFKADPSVLNAIGTTLDLGPFSSVAADPAKLLDMLNALLMHGAMSSQLRSEIIGTVTALPANTAADQLNRARTALYLILTSPQYQVEQ